VTGLKWLSWDDVTGIKWLSWDDVTGLNGMHKNVLIFFKEPKRRTLGI
jgi:hypothetical protein